MRLRDGLKSKKEKEYPVGKTVYTEKKRVRTKGVRHRKGLGEEIKEAQQKKEKEMKIWGSDHDL